MADRYWEVGHNMGYAGTDTEEVIDLVEHFGWTEDEVHDADNESVEKELANEQWQQAIENISNWASPSTEEDFNNG